MQEKRKVKVSERAVVARINRKLKHEGRYGEALRRSRSEGARLELGDWYVVDLDTNSLVAWHCTLEKLAKELGVLKPWEEIVE